MLHTVTLWVNNTVLMTKQGVWKFVYATYSNIVIILLIYLESLLFPWRNLQLSVQDLRSWTYVLNLMANFFWKYNPLPFVEKYKWAAKLCTNTSPDCTCHSDQSDDGTSGLCVDRTLQLSLMPPTLWLVLTDFDWSVKKVTQLQTILPCIPLHGVGWAGLSN